MLVAEKTVGKSVTAGGNGRKLIFVLGFAKPKTDAGEDKKSLSMSISEGLKRYNEKTREVVVRLLLLGVEVVEREKSQAEKQRELLYCRRYSQNFTAPRSKSVTWRF